MDLTFDALLKAVDLVMIIAIIGVTEAIKRALPEPYWRWIPVVPVMLGLGAGVIVSPGSGDWRVLAKAAMLYAGAASLGYELLRTTILKTGAKTPGQS